MNNLSYADALIKARRYETLAESNHVLGLPDNSATQSATKDQAKKSALKVAGDFVKNHKKQLGIGAGVAAGAVAAGVAAKKIHDKKAADKKQDVHKENYEYEEYSDLLEAVSECLTIDELLSEDASSMIINIADRFIEEAESNHVLGLPDNSATQSATKDQAKKSALKVAGDFVKNHKKQLGIGAGVAAGAVAAGVAAKKIHDKKAADKKQDVHKENYEYAGYDTLVECVISNFMSEDEIMAENASQIAMATADYMIENADRI